ncbi:MAG: class I SAM-dependent methyltransferase [Rhodospirillales bacterium]
MAENEPAAPDTDWETHWRHYARSTDLNPGQHYRRHLIGTLLSATGAGTDSRILDAGCGSGDLIRVMKARFPGAEFCGIEPSAEGAAASRVLCPGARIIQSGLSPMTEEVRELGNWATHAICSEVLEHVEDPVALLKDVARCLKPGGTLIVTVPAGPRTAFDLQIGHLRHYTRNLAKETVRAAGLSPVRTWTAGFPFFNIYRITVLLRGRRLANDVLGEPGMLARVVMAGFRLLMPLNLRATPFGWQIVVLARKP